MRRSEIPRVAGIYLDVPDPENESNLKKIDYAAVWAQYVDRDPRGLLLIGPRRRVLALNPAARQMLAYGDSIPRPVSEVVRDINFSFAVGEAVHDRQDVWHEVYVPDPDRLLRFHIVPILADSGEAFLTIATIEDVTRLRYLETVRRDFVANVSHELRTPLASINLLVETLQNGAIDDLDAAEHFLHRIEVETHAMAVLVEELLELSRLESGVLSLQPEPVAVRTVLESVVSRLTPAAQEKAVDLQIEQADGAAQVIADPQRIEQVLMNLVHNAIKFTPEGGRVTILAVRQGRGIQFDVLDTGVGMDAGEINRIFERFYKVDKGRNRAEGAGLGLAIARHLLELHGSRLTVVSAVDRGSRFSFALPVSD